MPRIKKNDIVQVIAGDDRGAKGKVLRVFPRQGKVIVEGVNFVKRHRRQTRADMPGGIQEKEAPIDISNVMLVCPKCSKPTRIGVSILPEGRKVRVCKHCHEMIDSI